MAVIKPTTKHTAGAGRLIAAVAATIVFSACATTLIVAWTPDAASAPNLALALVTTG